MQALRLLEKWLERNAIIGHQARVGALVRVVGALLSGGRLVLTHLGRHRAGRAFVKHHGFGLRYARTRCPERLEALLLVAALASFILWLLGLAARDRQWARHFQANTERRRTVLTTVFLG